MVKTTGNQVTIRIVSSLPENLAKQLIHIYQTSFPPSERVSPSELLRTVEEGRKILFVLEIRNNVAGFATVQRFSCLHVHYLEYMAISEKYRGLGYGSSLLQYIVGYVKPDQTIDGIVFEVEHPGYGSAQEKQLRKRRIEFYRRNGAQIIKEGRCYRMPDLSGEGSVPMYLMWLPQDIQNQSIYLKDIRNLFICLYKEVYGRDKDDNLLQSIIQDLDNHKGKKSLC